MIAVAAGYLAALADAGDARHARALASLHTQHQGWITSWPALTVACQVPGSRLGTHFSAALLDDAAEGKLASWTPGNDGVARIPGLMRKHASLPMDLADASLGLVAEHLGHRHVLSTDKRDFGADRRKRHQPFDNLLAA